MNDDMVNYYKQNPQHYTTGLTRIGCSYIQAKYYSDYFNDLRFYYYKFIQNEIKSKDNICSIIDFGCGTGEDGCGTGEDIFFLDKILKNICFYGFELSVDTIAINNNRLKKETIYNKIKFTNELTELPNEANIIINFCVLEHVNDPGQFIQECCNHLSNDGTIIVVFPNHYYWWYWDFMNLIISKLLHKNIKTHSVSFKKFLEIIKILGLQLVHHEIYGFRPPQVFFKYLCEHDSCHVQRRKNFKLISNSYQNLGLEKFLYLHLCILKKKVNGKINYHLNFNSKSFLISIYYFIISLNYVIYYQLIVLYQLIILLSIFLFEGGGKKNE